MRRGEHRSSDISAHNAPESLINIGVVVFIFLNFSARGILSVFETVNIPLFLRASGHDAASTAAVIEASNFQFYLGCVGLISYLSIEVFRHRISDVVWVLLGFGALGIGNAMLAFAPDQLGLPRLITSELFVWSIGCPITAAVVVAAFSKILGGRPQGTLMGLLGSAGSLSRIALPLLPSLIPSMGPLFIINVSMCLISVMGLKWYGGIVQRWKSSVDFVSERSFLLPTPRDQENENDMRSPLFAERELHPSQEDPYT